MRAIVPAHQSTSREMQYLRCRKLIVRRHHSHNLDTAWNYHWNAHTDEPAYYDSACLHSHHVISVHGDINGTRYVHPEATDRDLLRHVDSHHKH